MDLPDVGLIIRECLRVFLRGLSRGCDALTDVCNPSRPAGGSFTCHMSSGQCKAASNHLPAAVGALSLVCQLGWFILNGFKRRGTKMKMMNKNVHMRAHSRDKTAVL